MADRSSGFYDTGIERTGSLLIPYQTFNVFRPHSLQKFLASPDGGIFLIKQYLSGGLVPFCPVEHKQGAVVEKVLVGFTVQLLDPQLGGIKTVAVSTVRVSLQPRWNILLLIFRLRHGIRHQHRSI